MKTNKFSAALLLCIASIAGCSKDNGASDAPFLSIDKSEVHFTSAGNKAFVKYSSNRTVDFLNIAVQTDFGTEWCKAELHRNTIVVTVDENTSGKERGATIEITGETICEKLIVTQTAITIDVPKSVNVDAFEGARQTVDVITEASVWNVECEAEWIELSKDVAEKQFTVKCSENKTGDARTASVTVSSIDGHSAEVKITQSKHTLKIYGEKWQACDRLQSIVYWQVDTTSSDYEVTTDAPTWCIGVPDNGIAVAVALENTTGQERSATVTVTLNDGQSETVEIYQGKYAVGDLYENGDIKGVIYRYEATEAVSEGDKADAESEEVSQIVFGGNAVSLDEAELQWAAAYETTEAGSYINGAANTAAVKDNEELSADYPAIDWCISRNGGIWYLPAVVELSALLSAVTEDDEQLVNNAIEKNGGVVIDTSEGVRYISSTEKSEETVLAIIRTGGMFFSASSDKNAVCKVRAICAF